MRFEILSLNLLLYFLNFFVELGVYNGGTATAQSSSGNSPPPAHPEKPVQRSRHLPMGLRRLLEDLASQLPTAQVIYYHNNTFSSFQFMLVKRENYV